MEDFVSAVFYAMATGDDSRLRSFPEGREFLLKQALERRKEPLCIRRFPRVAGEAAARSIDNMVLEVIRHGQENKQIQQDPDW